MPRVRSVKCCEFREFGEVVGGNHVDWNSERRLPGSLGVSQQGIWGHMLWRGEQRAAGSAAS